MSQQQAISDEYDVIVAGGGPAGICAAAQAARAGASTLLVEKSACLGGTTTNGAINFAGLCHAWGKQVIAGIGWEIVERCVKESGSDMPDFSKFPDRHWKHQVLVDRAIYTALCDELVRDSGADILFHVMPATIKEHNSHKTLTVCTKTGLRDIQCSVLIDCTGDANLAHLAGYELIENEVKQPATLSCSASGYSMDTIDVPALNQAFDDYVKAGKAQYTDASWNAHAAHVESWLHKAGNNANHIPNIDAFSSEGKSALELEGRQSILRLYRFLKQQPGLENIQIDFLATECGVRDTRRIVGEKTIEVTDYLDGTVWDDGVCYSFYPIDLHTHDKGGVDCRKLAEGVVPSIPRGAMIPKGSHNFLCAGRCIASDQLAHSALRVQGSAMAMGQAAGAMAALAAKNQESVSELAMTDIHTLLQTHAAIVPPLAELTAAQG